MTELDVARAIASGAALSPQQFGNAWLIALRISGTGLADRPALGERVWRDPAVWLADETISRCAGLPVILDHPQEASLDAGEYADRSIGAVLHPYIADRQGIENTAGPDLWGIARIFVDAGLIEEIATQSTSPSVVFSAADGNETITLPDGTRCLVEAAPSLIDHIAIVMSGDGAGVWDKAGPDRGVRIDERTAQMTEEEKAAEEKTRKDASGGTEPDKLLSALGDLCGRLDAMSARMDAMEKDRSDAKRDAKKDDVGDPVPVAADRARKDAAAELEEETARSDAQARADAVASAFGEKAPPPLSGEAVSAYRARLARRFQRYSVDFKDADLRALADSTAFSGIESRIYADAIAASRTPDVPDGRIIERQSTHMGHQVSEFFGRGTFIAQMGRPGRRVTNIRTAMDRAAG